MLVQFLPATELQKREREREREERERERERERETNCLNNSHSTSCTHLNLLNGEIEKGCIVADGDQALWSDTAHASA